VPGKSIYFFIWGYQASYRIHIRNLARDVLKKLGAPTEAEALLVGVRSPESNNTNPVCVEPEDGKWQLSLFEGLLETVESTYQNHELQHVLWR
jgi:hypothetical protein